ncbi:MAG: hypothetical protein E6H54_21340 [Betaproteobacteria bacterium]|nr:MAG: hypothetical protein E6H54_21340 [Betaproteobacteria bacterium]
MAEHRAAHTAGDRADAGALAQHVDFLHFDDHAAVMAGGRDVLPGFRGLGRGEVLPLLRRP